MMAKFGGNVQRGRLTGDGSLVPLKLVDDAGPGAVATGRVDGALLGTDHEVVDVVQGEGEAGGSNCLGLLVLK